MVLAGPHRAGVEFECVRTHCGAGHLRAADPRGRFHGGDVLAHEAGFRTLAAHMDNAERLAGDQRARAGIAHHLPAAFTVRTVDLDHGIP